MSIGVILLAGGSSSRMGQSKQLLNIEGEPLLLRSAKVALESKAEKVIVVLGANEKAHRIIIQNLPIEILNNLNWQMGIGNSLKAGLNYLIKTYPFIEAVIIMVCDQPHLTANHLKKIIAEYISTSSPIIASRYSNTLGVPALFAKSYFNELLNLPNDQGARKIILQHSKFTSIIDFPEGFIDLDTPDDYRSYKSSNKPS